MNELNLKTVYTIKVFKRIKQSDEIEDKSYSYLHFQSKRLTETPLLSQKI